VRGSQGPVAVTWLAQQLASPRYLDWARPFSPLATSSPGTLPSNVPLSLSIHIPTTFPSHPPLKIAFEQFCSLLQSVRTILYT